MDILNACHEGEEMFLPYTIESLTARLERAPSEYTWSNLLLSDHAVAGVFREGEYIRYIETWADGRVETSTGGSLFDFGFLPAAEEEAHRLLGACCAGLLAAGMTGLSMFSSPGSRTWDCFRSVGLEGGRFDFWTPGVPEPPDVSSHGIYVDHIYF